MMTQSINFSSRKRFFRTMLAATCLVTFQAYLVAPIGAEMALELGASRRLLNFAIPSFAIPFGLSLFTFSLVTYRMNREKVANLLLIATSILMAALYEAHSGWMFLLFRALIGVSSGGIIMFYISLVNDVYRHGERGQAFDWLILALAAGMTFGPTAGSCFLPVIGWRWQFVVIACWALLIILYNAQKKPALPVHKLQPIEPKTIIRRCCMLIKSQDGRMIYPFIFLNGIYHSGLFVWISYYFQIRFHFGSQGTGLALLLFGLPGLLIAVSIGLAIKKFGNVRVFFWGIITVILTLAMLLVKGPFWLTLLLVGSLSLGYVMTLPFYTGIIDVIRNRNSWDIALGLGFGLLFLGYGTGPIVFISLLRSGIQPALILLSLLTVLLFLLAARGRMGTRNS